MGNIKAKPCALSDDELACRKAENIEDASRTENDEKKTVHTDLTIYERIFALLFNHTCPKGASLQYSGKSFPWFDINAKERDITFNLHSLEFEQLLKVWKINVTYKGKNIIETGRGVKGIKIRLGALLWAYLSDKFNRFFRRSKNARGTAA